VRALSRSDHLVSAWEHVALLGTLGLAFLLRDQLLGVRPLWYDEAFSLDVARKSIHEIWIFLRTNDAHPIGYYAVLSVWIRWFGTGLAEMRFSSVLFSLAAVFLTWRIARQLFSPPIGIVAAVLVAVNPYQIIASNEIRMYPLLECLALVSTWFLWRAAATPPGKGRPAPGWWWVGYGVSVAAMAYTSYYSFLLVPAHALWVFLSRPLRQAITSLGIAGATALALYVPWIPYVLTLPDRAPLPWRVPISGYYLSDLFASQTFGGYIAHMGTYHTVGGSLAAYHPLLLFPFLVLMAAGVFALGRVNRSARALVGLSWLIPLVAIVLASMIMGRMMAFPRHLIFLQPFAAVFVAAGVVHLREAVVAMPGVLVPLLGVLLLTTFAYPAVNEAQWNGAYQLYHYDLAAKFVRALYNSGDAVIYFPAGISLALHYYYTPPGEQIYIEVDPHRWSRTVTQPAIHRAAASLAARKVHRAWLIYSHPVPPGSLEDLTAAFKEQHFNQGPVEEFQGVWVTLFIGPST